MDATKSALLQSLEAQRRHVLGCLEGLNATALRTPVLPTGWYCLGLVQHLALDVERFWFRKNTAGQHFDEGRDDTSAWLVDPDLSPDAVFGLYRDEVAQANAVIAETSLDAAPQAWPDYLGELRLPELRAMLLHVITETACHAGHLDAAREIDGGTWLILG
jgi:hypothetical protein